MDRIHEGWAVAAQGYHRRCVVSIASAANPLVSADLAAFAAAVEAGSVRGAADALELTQSAVTKRIRSLERRVGARLLERGRFGVRTSEFGALLYPEVKRTLVQLEDLARLVDVYRARGGGELRLSASHTTGEYLLPAWLARFRGVRPDIHPQLEIVNSPGVLDAVRENRSEIGFVEGLDPLDGLQAITVARDEIVVVVGADHRWAKRSSIAPRDLLGEPYFTREAGSGTRAVASAALAQAGVELTPELQAASAQSLKRAVASGGFTLMSRLSIQAEQRAGTHVALAVRGVELHRELRAVHRERPALQGPARTFWRWLVSETAPGREDADASP